MAPPPSFTSRRRPLALLNMVCSILLTVSAVILINYLAARHPIRMKWVEHDRFALSSLTKGILEGLSEEVEAIVYHDPEKATALHSSIEGLLQEYAFHSPHLKVRHVDYLRERREAQEIADRFNIDDRAPSGIIIFSASDRSRIVSHQELREYQTAAAANALVQGQRDVKRVGFKGELLFTSAILNITSGEALKVAYLTGHGEHDIDSDALNGYAAFRQALEEKHFELIPHHFIQDGPLPDSIPLLIIAGPTERFAREEVDEIQHFLERGGRLWTLFNYNGVQQANGLEPLLSKWGIKVGMNVVDDIHKLAGSDLALANYEDHPVTTPLVDAKAGLLMFLPRSIDPLPRSDTLQSKNLNVQGIAYTSTNGLTKTDFSSGRPEFSHYRDRKGAISVLAAATAKANRQRQPTLSDETRLLVVGDSFFLSNSRIQQYGNRDFATLAAGWLLDQYQLLQGIGPQALYEFKIAVPDADFKRLQISLLVVYPGLVFGLGIIVWWRRRF